MHAHAFHIHGLHYYIHTFLFHAYVYFTNHEKAVENELANLSKKLMFEGVLKVELIISRTWDLSRSPIFLSNSF